MNNIPPGNSNAMAVEPGEIVTFELLGMGTAVVVKLSCILGHEIGLNHRFESRN